MARMNHTAADCATNPLLRALLHFTAHLLHNRNRAATVLQAVPPSPCVVGYNRLMHNPSAVKSPQFGFCFTPIANGSMILGDFAPVDGEVTVDDDCILVINPTTLGTAAFFTYLDKTTADAIAIEEGGEAGDLDEYIGWWDENIGVFEDDAKRDSYVVNPGAGFMGYFESGNEIHFQLPAATATLL